MLVLFHTGGVLAELLPDAQWDTPVMGRIVPLLIYFLA